MRTSVAAVLVGTLLLSSSALAAPIPSRGAPAPQSLQQAVEKNDVAQQLDRIGRAADIEALTPADIHQIASNPQQLQTAGGLTAKTWVAIGMVVIFVAALAVLGDEDEEQNPSATK